MQKSTAEYFTAPCKWVETRRTTLDSIKLRGTDQRNRATISGGRFHGPVQVGGNQVNLYRFSTRHTVLIIALIATLTGTAWLSYHLYTSSDSYRMRAEEVLLGDLKPGQGYYKINQMLGSEPDYSIRLNSGNKLHQYEREWETLQVLEDKAGATLSIGIYAKIPTFRPSTAIGGLNIQINATTIGHVGAPLPPAAANAYCGAHKGGYFEAYYPMPNALGARNLVVGISNANSNINVSQACGIEKASKCEAPDTAPDNRLFESFARCILRSRNAQIIRNELKISALIVTSPGQGVIPDMLYPPDSPEGGGLV
ncbi:hypothetical protein ACFYYI_34120 [Streptomyces sp. NPDC002387]|uniref:hypothetical protein n=1 Tax=Streptomyces sp. NPDC002387 TaxID=3364643 RepID=UPI00368097D4